MPKEFIERGALIARYDAEHIGSPGRARELIATAPAADVAEVVRCRERVHWKPIGSKAGNSFSDMEYIGGCEYTKYCRRESDFCSYGERKEGAD